MKKISLLFALICFSISLVAQDEEVLTEELNVLLKDFADKYDNRVSVSGMDLHYYHNEKIQIEKKLGQQITDLLLRGARVESSSKYAPSYKPIHFAAESGNMPLLELLLDKKANIDAQADKKWTPLFFAAHNNHRKICKKLLDCDANAKLVDEQGQTCLMVAGFDCIKIFSGKLDINARREDLATAAHLAAENDHVETLKKLLQMGAQLPLKPSNPVVKGSSYVTKRENWPLEMLLIGAGHSMSSLGYGGPHSPLLNKFLQQNASGPQEHLFNEALEKSDHERIVKILGDNYKLPEEHVLYTAIRLKDEKILESVLKNLKEHEKMDQINDILCYETTPLFFALYLKNIKAVSILLEFGADPGYRLHDLAYRGKRD